MSWLFDDDLTWCADGQWCGHKECYRNILNRIPPEDGSINLFTCGYLMRSDFCPYFEEVENET